MVLPFVVDASRRQIVSDKISVQAGKGGVPHSHPPVVAANQPFGRFQDVATRPPLSARPREAGWRAIWLGRYQMSGAGFRVASVSCRAAQLVCPPLTAGQKAVAHIAEDGQRLDHRYRSGSWAGSDRCSDGRRRSRAQNPVPPNVHWLLSCGREVGRRRAAAVDDLASDSKASGSRRQAQ